MKKPTVLFLNNAEFETRTLPEELLPTYKKYVTDKLTYEVAHIYALNHPKLGHGYVRTSMVIKKYKNGNFETLNTLYKKST